MKSRLSTPLKSAYFLAPILGLASSLSGQTTISGLAGQESFGGYSDGFIGGQTTSSTTGFAGTEAWVRNNANNDARDFWARPDAGLSYPGLISSGGSIELARNGTFNDTSGSGNTATLTSSSPINNITNTELFFSGIFNADGYTFRGNDAANQGAEITFLHGGAENNRIGIFYGGTDSANPLSIVYRVTGGTAMQPVNGVSLNSGDNFFVLGVNAHSANAGVATYSLWLNPDLSSGIRDTAQIGDADFTFDTDFGVVPNNSSFGFNGFQLFHRYNQEQSIFVDELSVGSDFASVTVIPEPSTYAMIALLGAIGMIIRRRFRTAK